jgi:hypothetical protein
MLKLVVGKLRLIMSSVGAGTGPVGDPDLSRVNYPPINFDRTSPDDEGEMGDSDTFNDTASIASMDPSSLVDVSLTVNVDSVSVKPEDNVRTQLTISKAQLDQVSHLIQSAAILLIPSESYAERRVDKYESATTSFDLTQQLASSISSGASIVSNPAPNTAAQGLFVVSTSISSVLGGFCTILTISEASALKDVIALKERDLSDNKDVAKQEELKRELVALRQQSNVLIGLAVMGAIDSSSSTSAFGIQMSQTTVQSASMAANVLGAAASLVGVMVSSYNLYSNRDKEKILNKKIEAANALYDQKLPEETEKAIEEVYEDICLLRDSNLAVQKNDLVVSNIQNGLILAGSLLGLAQSLVMIIAGSSTLLITCLGIGAVIGIGIGVTIGLSYYTFKKRHTIENRFSKAVNFFSNDPKKLALLNQEAVYLSGLEKFDATYAVINKKIEQIKIRREQILKEISALQLSGKETTEIEKTYDDLNAKLAKYINLQKTSVEDRLKRLDTKLRQIIGTKNGNFIVYDTLIRLGVPEQEIVPADINRMISQLHKALVS